MAQRRQFDGIGILLLGLCALLATLVALAWGIRPPPVAQDIDAQTSMAWAAWAMVAVSAVSLIVGAISLFLIFETLREARRSANAAELAVNHAAATVDAANATTRETIKLGQAQARCYLVVKGGRIVISDSGTVAVDYEFANSGQTPALRVWVTTAFWFEFLDPDNEWTPHPKRFHERLERSDIPAEADREADGKWLEFVDDEMLARGQQPARILVDITLECRDVFGVEHRETVYYGVTFPLGIQFGRHVLYRVHR